MDQNHENAGAPEGAAVSEESQPQAEPQSEGSYEGNADGWGDALEAYEEAEGAPEAVDSEEEPASDQQDQQESESKSHFEQDEPKKAGDLDLDKLAVPHKYKNKVKEFVEPIVQEHQRQVQAVQGQLGEFQQGLNSFVEVFKNIAQNPSALADYVIEHGETFGLDPNLISNYRKVKAKGSMPQLPQSPQQQAPKAQQTPVGLDAVFNKYVDQLISTPDPKAFATTLKSMLQESLSAKESEMMGVFQQLLGGYHEKVIDPNLQTIKEQKAKAEYEAIRGTWNSARDSVASKYQDFKSYEGPIAERLKKDPRTALLKKDPRAAQQAGITHEALVEEAYLILSRNDHIAKAKTPAPKEWKGGLPPSGKHINTTKAGGSDWEEIKRNVYGD